MADTTVRMGGNPVARNDARRIGARTHNARSGARTPRRRARWAALPAAALALLLSACTSQDGAGQPQGSPAASGPAGSSSAAARSASSSPAVRLPVRLTARPAALADVNPIEPVSVTAAHGTLSSVRMVNSIGRIVSGAYSADRTSWHTTEVLGYSRTYRLVAHASNGAGERVDTLRRTFTTYTPQNQTMPYLNTLYGTAIQNGATYGIGMIPVVHFDEPIPDRKSAERALHVTTSPHVDGSWYWLDDSDVHWRPKDFYTPGTRVTIDAMVYGKDLGAGLYGQSDQHISFRIGASHISVADARTHQVKVYFDGKLKRTMPTSMGMGGTTPGKDGKTIYLWTMPGTYTVIGHENPAIMSSDSYGLPANSKYGYPAEKVPYATKISVDGIYLHELDTTVWAQGHENLSHGCLNLNETNASWYYRTSRVGDVVKVINSGGPEIQGWQGGDWSVPWSVWQKGSALS